MQAAAVLSFHGRGKGGWPFTLLPLTRASRGSKLPVMPGPWGSPQRRSGAEGRAIEGGGRAGR